MATLAISLAGAAIGNAASIGFLGLTGAQVGFMAGSVLGNYLFAPKMPDQEGPRLSDLSITTATEGASIPTIIATGRLAGTIIAAGDIIETKHAEEVGGKGGGGSTVTTYTYSATFAVSLGDYWNLLPVGLYKLWLNKNCIFDITGDTTVVETSKDISYTFYDGTQTEPDSELEAIFGRMY